MSALQLTIKLEFPGFWSASTGGSGGGIADMPAYRDRDRCPAMPMSQVKGILRETCDWAYGKDESAKLFGASESGAANASALLAFIGEARLPENDRKWFSQNTAARAQLFRQIMATKINSSGVAADKTLRSSEVCVPMVLEGDLMLNGTWEEWREKLNVICALTLAMGKDKGNAGKVFVSIAEKNNDGGDNT